MKKGTLRFIIIVVLVVLLLGVMAPMFSGGM